MSFVVQDILQLGNNRVAEWKQGFTGDTMDVWPSVVGQTFLGVPMLPLLTPNSNTVRCYFTALHTDTYEQLEQN